jgi:hypothetical protein
VQQQFIITTEQVLGPNAGRGLYLLIGYHTRLLHFCWYCCCCSAAGRCTKAPVKDGLLLPILHTCKHNLNMTAAMYTHHTLGPLPSLATSHQTGS